MTNTRQSAMETATMRSVVPAARIAGLVTTEAGDEVLVYDQEKHHIHHLNHTASVIWRLCDGKRTEDEIRQGVEERLGAEAADIVNVRLALAKLDTVHLLVARLDSPSENSTQSRRELMKRVAAAGAGAAIVSITAPMAASAASCSHSVPCHNVRDPCCAPCGHGIGFGAGVCALGDGVVVCANVLC